MIPSKPLLCSLLLLLFLLGACAGEEDLGAEDAAPERDVPTYEGGVIRLSAAFAANIGLEVVELTAKELTPVVFVTGTLELNELRIAAVGSRISGRVRQVHVVEGSNVAVGDPLATLDSAELGEAQAEILAMQARARVADTDEARKRTLMSQGIASKRAAELASQTSSVADAELMAARQRVKALGGDVRGKKLGLLTLTSPIEGEVIAVHVFRGQAVLPSHTAFTIGDYDELWVRLAVFERDLHDIHEGDPVEIRSVVNPADTITGEVAYISPMIDPQTRAAEVRVVVPNPDGKLRVGQGVTAGIRATAGTHRGLGVPRQAIVQVDGKPTVFVVTDEGADGFSVVPRPVTLGIRALQEVEVIEGLDPGARVVTEGVFALKSETFR